MLECIVTKFGGSSLASDEQFRKVRSILELEPTRRYLVPSAPGKRFPKDEKVTDLLYQFERQRKTLIMPEIPEGSFAKKLYSTYLSYLPPEKMVLEFHSNVDERGSFTEMVKTLNCGQFSVNVSKPGITKGQHWHNTKWEMFMVVSGRALIQERKIDTDEVIEFEADGDHLKAVYMLPGYTHNIINLSKTENLVTLMWANELFDPKHPDTFYLKVKED